MAKNKNLDTEQIIQAFIMYEQGETMSKCLLWLGVSRKTFCAYLTGDYRGECRQEHLKQYPKGKVAQYHKHSGIVFYCGTH